MKQKPMEVVPQEQPKVAKPQDTKHKPLNEDLMKKMDKVLEKKQDEDPVVWTCATRLTAGGCMRPAEGRPPECPIYTNKKHPLYVVPVRVRLSEVKSKLDLKTGLRKRGRK